MGRQMREEKEVPKHEPEGIYDFRCECGCGMAVNGQQLRGDILSGMSYKCPGRLYGKCKRTFAAQYIKDNAMFIPPQRKDIL